MLTPFRSAIALIAVLLQVTVSSMPLHSAAQEFETATGLLDISDLNGIVHAGARSYSMDIKEIVEHVENGDAQAPAPDGPTLMMLLVAQFESPGHASDSVETIRDHFLDQLSTEHPGYELDATEIEDAGDSAVQISGDGPGQETDVGGYVVQDGEWLYFAIALSTNDTSDDAARDLIDFAIDQHPGPDDIQYDHTGASTGGLWNKLPARDDGNALSGTVPIFDNYLLPPEEGGQVAM